VAATLSSLFSCTPDDLVLLNRIIIQWRISPRYCLTIPSLVPWAWSGFSEQFVGHALFLMPPYSTMPHGDNVVALNNVSQ
jgi:hypothetical protein